MYYKKKPVVIQAIQYTGSFEKMIETWGDEFHSVLFHKGDIPLLVTLEGDHEVSQNDFIIRGIKGEFYACKPDIFELSYESVEYIPFGKAR